MSKSKIRMLEMAICFSDMTWSAGYFVEIPLNTPEDRLEEVGYQVIEADSEWYSPEHHAEIVKIWMYSSHECKLKNIE